MTTISFLKMHGAGNDFVIIDARKEPVTLTDTHICWIADRHKGVGFDQLIIMEPARNADCFMRIYNPDASTSSTCGNATRCIASLLLKESGKKTTIIETSAGFLEVQKISGTLYSVDMGKPQLGWHDIPLSEERDTLHLGIEAGELKDPVGVSMGNPHAVFFVNNVDSINLANLGPILEHHSLFPQRANINVAEIINRSQIKLRVWERGAGETLACGSGACATLVAARRRKLIDSNQALVTLKGGQLTIRQQENNDHVMMIGSASHSFSGTLQVE